MRTNGEPCVVLSECGHYVVDLMLDGSGKGLPPGTELQTHGTVIHERAALGHPALTHQVLHDLPHGRRLDVQGGCNFSQPGFCMPTEIEHHSCLQRSHPDQC